MADYLAITGYGAVKCDKAAMPRPIPVLTGDSGRKYAGGYYQDIGARKTDWPVTQMPVPSADAEALRAVLEGVQPVECSGEMLGATVNCFAEITGETHQYIGLNLYKALIFMLHEA